MKTKRWKPILATALCATLVGGVIYYTNWIYIPRMKAQQAVDTVQPDSSDADSSSDYQYTINASNPVSSSSSSADDDVKVTQEDNGDVTVSRTWDSKESDLDTTVSSPDETTSANIASGGDTITGTDGTYKGESTTTSGTGTTTTTTSTSGSTSSSTPSYGDTRTVDGQKQIYTPGFGWVTDTSGGEPVYEEGPALTGNQVGNMG